MSKNLRVEFLKFKEQEESQVQPDFKYDTLSINFRLIQFTELQYEHLRTRFS